MKIISRAPSDARARCAMPAPRSRTGRRTPHGNPPARPHIPFDARADLIDSPAEVPAVGIGRDHYAPAHILAIDGVHGPARYTTSATLPRGIIPRVELMAMFSMSSLVWRRESSSFTVISLGIPSSNTCETTSPPSITLIYSANSPVGIPFRARSSCADGYRSAAAESAARC